MGKTAVLSFLVGEALMRRVLGSATSEALAGVGQLLIGLAAAVAAISGMRNGRKLTHVKNKAEDAADKAKAAAAVSAGVSESIGPANGSNVLELLHEIKAFEEYQHSRNHDILNGLTQLTSTVPVLMEVLERNAAQLKTASPDKGEQP